MPFSSRLLNRMRDERAFGVIEALMAMTIMTVVLLALLGLLTASVKAVASSKLSSVATQIANESIEKVRAMDYTLVDTSTLSSETKTASGMEFTINYSVTWIDDPVDGTGASDAADKTENKTHDYKQVVVAVSWAENGTTRTVSASTYVKDKPVQTDPPTVDFICGETPPDGAVFTGLVDSPYKAWFDANAIPLKASATDPNGDLVTMHFIIDVKTPNNGSYSISPTNSYTNNYPLCYWNLNTKDETTHEYAWGEGTHQVTVEVWDAHGNRDAKSIFWTIDRVAPDAPANLTTQTVSNNSVNLAWSAAMDGSDQAKRYQIYRQGSMVADTTFTAMTFNDTGLTPWTTYNYYVKAVSAGGRISNPSSTITVTTLFTITCTVSSNKKDVTIQWDSPPVGVTVDSFDVIRNGAVVKSGLAGSSTQYTDSLPSGSGTYTYQVKAYNGGAFVNQSITVSVSV